MDQSRRPKSKGPRPPEAVRYAWMESPVARLLLTSDGERLTGLHMEGGRGIPDVGPAWQRDPAWFGPVLAVLSAYFAGDRPLFDVPLRLEGTAFQRAVWDALLRIPYGTTVTYGFLAAAIGRPTASRAVGMAVGQNPVSIIVPCHRVIGQNGSLTGYGGGLERKAWLLRHEGALPVG